MNNYKFYSSDDVINISPINNEYKDIASPLDLYTKLLSLWCKETCAPRMRICWSKDNVTLGQCSITSFLVQDIFGGEVYGIPRPDGNYHCFNYINGIIFDLTSEQFKGEELLYTLNYPQDRTLHFSKIEKYNRYLLLKNLLFNK